VAVGVWLHHLVREADRSPMGVVFDAMSSAVGEGGGGGIRSCGKCAIV